MQRDEDPPRGAQAAEPNPASVMAALSNLQLSEDSEAQITSFVESLSQGISGPRFRKLLTYILKFVEHNRSKYELLRTEHSILTDQASATRNELSRILEILHERLPPVAPVQGTPVTPAVATQPLPATMPSAPAALALPSVSQAVPVPSASQAIDPPPLATQATGIAPLVPPAILPPAIQNADGTVSRRMDQVGNNAFVTFSGDDEMASKKAKLFGSSAKYDIFMGYDMNQFPEWIAQFLSGVNLFQPTEPNACKIALQLMRGKAAEMPKNVSQQVTMQNLQELLTTLDRIFNTTGNRIVAVGLFNSFTQREDLSVQDYSIRIEQLFYRAYPGMNPDGSIFLMDRFINGLVSLEVKQRLRIPPQPGYFREAVERAMSLIAAIYHSDQVLKQRSMAWKMAASASNPLNTKSPRNPKGSIQMIETPENNATTVQVIRKWCTLHKTENHSNADCRAQKESATNNTTTSKKRPKGKIKRKSKPRKLKFKSNSDKKKFLRSIEDTEGVSLESASSDDEDVVEQSLMQLENASGNTSDDEEEGEVHILVLTPDLLKDQDIAMDSVLLYPDQSITTEALDSAVGAIRLEGEKVDSPMSTKAEFSSSEATLENTSMTTPVVSIQPYKEEENPFSPDLDSIPLMDEDMFPSLETPQDFHPDPANSIVPIPTPNYIIIGGVCYQQVPPPHNVVVAQSSIPTPALVPVAMFLQC